MKIIIRADMNRTVATGHVMRCLSIADGLQSTDSEVLFVSASEDPRELITARGYECRVLYTDFSKMEEELDAFKEVIDGFGPDIIILDSYYVTTPYFEALREYAKLVYVDDYGKEAYPVDMVINYNIYGKASDYVSLYEDAGVPCPELCCGCAFAPLREEFIDVNPVSVKEKGPYEILVTTGGADALKMARAIADAFLENPIPEARLNLLVGTFSGDREYLEELADANPQIMKVYMGITDMPVFLKKFDIALSAAGSTSYELSRMGLPTMLFSMADNQSKINETFDALKLMESAGSAESDKGSVILRLLEWAGKALPDYGYRVTKHNALVNAVDGKGARRIAERLASPRGEAVTKGD